MVVESLLTLFFLFL